MASFEVVLERDVSSYSAVLERPQLLASVAIALLGRLHCRLRQAGQQTQEVRVFSSRCLPDMVCGCRVGDVYYD